MKKNYLLLTNVGICIIAVLIFKIIDIARKQTTLTSTTNQFAIIQDPIKLNQLPQPLTQPRAQSQIKPELQIKPEITLQEICQPPIAEQIIKVDTNNSSLTPAPYLNYLTFNRLGLTIKNLNNILESDENFEMHITDCNSQDSTWDYIKSLDDKRIKSRTKFKYNLGPIYALNYNLTKRKPNQYFFTVDSDVYIKTKNWMVKYLEIFEAFPEVGLLGVMRDNPYPRFLPPIIPRVKGELSYLELKNAQINGIMDFIPGCLQALRPELINEIGYWSEENGYGDAEISPRILHFTPFKAGFLTTVDIDMAQSIGCNECEGQNICTLSRSINSCFMLSKKSNINESFAKKFNWNYMECFKELEEGKRTAYCASVLDPKSRESHVYNEEWALKNFRYYFNKSNNIKY